MDKLLTVEDVSELLGVKICTIYQWTHMKCIPHIKVGRFVRFREADLGRWLEKHSVKATTHQEIADRILSRPTPK